jgi:hypothetical protein
MSKFETVHTTNKGGDFKTISTTKQQHSAGLQMYENKETQIKATQFPYFDINYTYKTPVKGRAYISVHNMCSKITNKVYLENDLEHSINTRQKRCIPLGTYCILSKCVLDINLL